jgi:Ca2+-binding EF-hand superfamily protein
MNDGKVRALVLGLAWLAPGATAAAQDGAGASKQFLKSLDANVDGAVARSEWKGSGATFVALDADRDGYLTADELARKPAPKKAEGDAAKLAADRLQVALGALPDPPEVFLARCTACHDPGRIVRATKNASGWTDTVARMRAKKEAKISEREARQIVEYLDGLRAPIARRLIGYGTEDPVRDWAFVLGSGDLHLFDRDSNGRLDAGELQRLAFERADLDASAGLSPGEYALLPLSADRRATFAKLDRDRDGALSMKEMGPPAALLELADANRDGALARDEVPRARPGGGPYPMILATDAKVALEILDRNRDGRLSNKELERFSATAQRFDEDRDGSLDARELETAVTAARAEGPYAAFDDFFTRYDLDGDGEVSRLEFPGTDALFLRLDADGDGAVGSREAPASLRRPDFTPEAQRWRG